MVGTKKQQPSGGQAMKGGCMVWYTSRPSLLLLLLQSAPPTVTLLSLLEKHALEKRARGTDVSLEEST